MSEDKDRSEDFEPLEGEDELRGRLFERTVPEVFKRVIERAVARSVERLAEAPENLRELIDDVKLPKEAGQVIYDQIDDTKKGVYRVVAKEIRDVLEHMNFADEIAEVLTKLQFEINTTIRFVPNERDEHEEGESGSEDGEHRGDEHRGEHRGKRPSVIPTPKVVSKVVMKARDKLKPR
ncbi:MAG: hypothetical protein KC731_18195 [Myxococcales bacterium]|nr:hypothetical protein [Myxococcales bacterium]